MILYDAIEETRKLCSGVFWVISDNNDLLDHKLLPFEIPCDSNGNPVGSNIIELNSKSGRTYNHKKLWENEVKGNSAHKPYNRKTYDYYPRGRVEVSNNRATIYLNPYINQPEFIAEIKQKFGLNEHDISEVRVINDNSVHYQCFLDREGE